MLGCDLFISQLYYYLPNILVRACAAADLGRALSLNPSKNRLPKALRDIKVEDCIELAQKDIERSVYNLVSCFEFIL